MVLGISSDGDDRRIFLGLKFSIPGIFGELDLSRDLWGVLKRIGSALAAYVCGFLGVNFWSRDFFWFCWKP